MSSSAGSVREKKKKAANVGEWARGSASVERKPESANRNFGRIRNSSNRQGGVDNKPVHVPVNETEI